MGKSPESYLVRIYRRDDRDPERVAGLVELIERDRTETFKSAGELLKILGIGSASAGDGPGRRGNKEESEGKIR